MDLLGRPKLTQSDSGAGLMSYPNSQALRTKAVMRTNEGWWTFNFATKLNSSAPPVTAETRLEILIDGEDYPNLEELKAALVNCLTSLPTPGALQLSRSQQVLTISPISTCKRLANAPQLLALSPRHEQ